MGIKIEMKEILKGDNTKVRTGKSAFDALSHSGRSNIGGSIATTGYYKIISSFFNSSDKTAYFNTLYGDDLSNIQTNINIKSRPFWNNASICKSDRRQIRVGDIIKVHSVDLVEVCRPNYKPYKSYEIVWEIVE